MRHVARALTRNVRSARLIWGAAVVSLALGIGAQTAIFSIVNALSLRTLPVAAPEELVTLTTPTDAVQNQPGTFSYATFDAIRRYKLFDAALAWSPASLPIDDGRQTARALWVSGDFFSTLGVNPAIGRTLVPADDASGGGPDGLVAVIGDRLWQQRFGRSPAAIGSRIVVERTAVTIVGVTPPEFFGVEVGRAYDLYLPLRTQPQITPNAPASVDMAILAVMFRLRDGESVEAATAALRRAQSDIRAASAPAGAVDYLQEPFALLGAARGTSTLRQRYEGPLLAILGVATIVLVIACGNVASLMLVRGVARRRELSVRLALGASRWTVVRLLFSESLLIALAGVGLGVLVAVWGARTLTAQFAGGSDAAFDPSLDWRVFLFASAAGLVAASIVGILPALHASRLAPGDVLNAEGRMPGSGARLKALDAVLVCQTAMALLLVLTAGLFLRTVQELHRVPLGFDAEGVLAVSIAAPHVRPQDRNSVYHRLVEAVSSVPGVVHAGGGLSQPLRRVGVPVALSVSGGRRLTQAESLSYGDDVTPGWRQAYGLELRAGRDIDERDIREALPVALVNEAFVRRFFPGENILGRTVSMTAHIPPDGVVPIGERTIVGIVEDAAHDSLRGAKRPMFYRPLAQREGPLFIPFNLLVRRTSTSTETLTEDVAAALRRVDPELRLNFETLAEAVDAALTEERLLALVSVSGGLFALILAAVGLYGVTAYGVAARKVEIGVRLALGGVPKTIVKFVMTQVGATLAVGIVAGIAASLWASQFIASQFFGVAPGDPLVVSISVFAMVVIGNLAAWLPARQAAFSDPARALRDV